LNISGAAVNPFAQLEPRWRITVYYLIALCTVVFVAKIVSLILSRGTLKERLAFFFLAPALSVETWRQVRRLRTHEVPRILVRASLALAALAIGYVFVPAAISRPEFSWPIRSYLAVVPFWLLTETISSITQLCYTPFLLQIPDAHSQPWHSRTLAEFWGRRWNRLFGDWFRQVCFRPMFRRPRLAILCAFFVSAVMHEYLVNLPLWAVYGKNLFGSMSLYFLIQAVGIVIERTYLRRHWEMNRAFAWLTILAPLPLVLNEATLRVFQFVR
jgi:hypothetical protein